MRTDRSIRSALLRESSDRAFTGRLGPRLRLCSLTTHALDAAIFREWSVNVGQRAAHNRLAHLIVELRERLRLIGGVTGDAFAMPLTQEQLGEAMGMTSVHTNRILRQLRLDGVLELQRGMVKILNETRLQDLAQFDGRYLHLSPAS